MNLAKDKKLALSMALNLLLAVALSFLLYLSYPQFVYRLESVENCGCYSVRTYRNWARGTGYFEIMMGPEAWDREPHVPRRVYSCSGEEQFFVEEFDVDVTGKGIPNLVVSRYNGGAHGDFRYLVFELDGRAVKELDVIDGLVAELRDVNQDGILEMVGTDQSYGYFLGGSYAASPCPEVVLSFDRTQGRFVLDRKLMSKRPLPQDQLDKLSLDCKNNARWHEESRPPSELFGTMLDLIYCGNEKQAWELFDASWPDGSTVSKEQYREDVKGELSRSPFYPVIADWNKEKS